jgi:hypothetical protein
MVQKLGKKWTPSRGQYSGDAVVMISVPATFAEPSRS